MAKKRKTSGCSYHDSKTNKKKDDEQNKSPSTVVEVDRYVPELPDLVIHQILLFLTLLSPKHAARASLVSKQWASIWFSLPVLAFEEYYQDPKPYTDDKARRKQFINFVNTNLKRWEKDKRDLDKLRLRMKYSASRGTIQKCLSFAVDRNVKEIDISFTRESIAGQRCKTFSLSPMQRCKTFSLSPMLLNSAKSLTILKLENVNLLRDVTSAIISLPSLKTMSLNHLRSNLTFLQLLSGCPLLENLLLNSCVGFYGVLSSSSLKSLEVVHCKSLQVQAENLESIKLDSNESFDITSCERVAIRNFLSEYFGGFNSKLDLLESMILNRYPGNYQCNISSQHLKCFVSFGSALFGTKLTMNCPNLDEAKIIVQDWIPRDGKWWHSCLILVLGSFDCCKKLSLNFNKAEALIFPEEMRSKCSPPLPTLDYLQVEISNTSITAVPDSVLLDSLRWMAPSSQVSICKI